MIVYLNGRFLPKEEACLSPDDRGFLFADGAYEVLHAYDGHLFRIEDHLARMARSLRALHITAPTPAQLGDIAATLIQRNALTHGHAVVYVQITRGAAPRKHAFPPDGTPATVYAFVYRHTLPTEQQAQGVRALLVPDNRWTHCDIKSIALLPNVLANREAQEHDAYEAVFVRDGMLTEGARSNVCAVFDGRLVTYPESPYILSGITRKVILELCVSLHIPILERPILEIDLPEADELFLCNTTSEILPVTHVNDEAVGDGRPGPITRTLQRAYRECTALERLNVER